MTVSSRQFRQQRLFNPLSVPRKQPHQMGLMEFASSPRTWWHASDEGDVNELRENADYDAEWHNNGWVDKGFHVGTLAAAVERAGSRAGDKHKRFLHPGRIDVQMENTPATRDEDSGESWTFEDHERYYRNEYEDKGSTSAILGSPHSFKTHGDFVAEAIDRGGIPSGAAEYDSQRNRALPFHRVDVHQTDEVLERHPQPYGTEETVHRMAIDYKSPERLARGTTRFNEPYEAHQGFMFEGPGSGTPKVRRSLINDKQFSG